MRYCIRSRMTAFTWFMPSATSAIMGASEGALLARPMGWTLPVADAVMTSAMWRREMLKESGNRLPDAAEEAKSPRYWTTHRSGGKPVPAFPGDALLTDHGGRPVEALSREHGQYRRGAGLHSGRAGAGHPGGGRAR